MRWSRRTFRFTREGKAFLAVTFGVGIAAVNTGNNLLYLVLGLMLSTLLLSGVLSELALRKVRVRRALPVRAFEGEPCLVEVRLANRKRRAASFSLSVEDRTDHGPTGRRAYFLKVPPRSEQVVSYPFVPPRRGRIVFDELYVCTRYPFGLIEKGHRVRDRAELVAYPRLVPVAEEMPAGAGPEPSEMPTRRPGAGSEPAGVREYLPGDEARAIHWRRTASLGRIVARERQRDAVARLVIELGGEADFERAVRVAASRAVRALGRGAAVEVHTTSGRSPMALPGSSPDAILKFLALLDRPS